MAEMEEGTLLQCKCPGCVGIRTRQFLDAGLMGWTQPSLFTAASDRARMVHNHHDEKRGRVRDER